MLEGDDAPRMTEADRMMGELGTDGTFASSYRSVSHWTDIIFALLGMGTAFKVAQQFGEKED